MAKRSGEPKTKQPPNGKRDPALCKRNPWRPKKYDDPEELEALVDEFFEYCSKTMITVQHPHSKGVTKVKTPTPPTMAGLAAWLGMTRQALLSWKADDRFFVVITRARQRIEADNVVNGISGAYESRINGLNLASNFGYAQKTESAITGANGGPIQFTDTERAARLAAILEAVKKRSG